MSAYPMFYSECITDFRCRMGDEPDAEITLPASYALIECPELAQGTHYRLVKMLPDDAKQLLLEERAVQAAPSLNLARIRHIGACLGASRVEIVDAGD